eukprot:5720725-Pyramimonas_sp.AAC.1
MCIRDRSIYTPVRDNSDPGAVCAVVGTPTRAATTLRRRVHARCITQDQEGRLRLGKETRWRWRRCWPCSWR